MCHNPQMKAQSASHNPLLFLTWLVFECVGVIGSIAICQERAKEQAEEYGHSYERELHYLIVHGIMHCFGYDHIEEDDRKLMREKEEEILTKLGITRE